MTRDKDQLKVLETLYNLSEEVSSLRADHTDPTRHLYNLSDRVREAAESGGLALPERVLRAMP